MRIKLLFCRVLAASKLFYPANTRYHATSRTVPSVEIDGDLYAWLQLRFDSRSTGVQLLIMRPSSLGGAAYCVALCLSVRPVMVTERHVAPPSELQ